MPFSLMFCLFAPPYPKITAAFLILFPFLNINYYFLTIYLYFCLVLSEFCVIIKLQKLINNFVILFETVSCDHY